MITSYVRPQVSIAQRLTATDSQTLDRLHAVVIGPAYLNASASDENLVWSAFSDGEQLSYRYLDQAGTVQTKAASRAVELADVLVRGRNMRLQLWNKGTAQTVPASQFRTHRTDPTGDVLQYVDGSGDDTPFLDLNNPAVAQAFDNGRAPQPGDILLVEGSVGGNPASVERVVSALLGSEEAAAAGSPVFTGAAELTSSLVSNADVTYSNTELLDEEAAWASEPSSSNAIWWFARKYGTARPAGGLRLSINVSCTTAGAVGGTAAFLATVNGINVAATAAAGSAGPPGYFNLTLDFASIIGGGSNVVLRIYTSDNSAAPTFASGDRFTVVTDLECADYSGLFDGAVDVSAYTWDAATRKVESTLTIEVTDITYGASLAATALALRITDSRGLATTTTFTPTFGGTTTVAVPYDGVELVVNADVAGSLSGIDTLDKLPHVGAKWSIPITPPKLSTTQFDKIKLGGSIGMEGALAGLEVTAYQLYTGAFQAAEPVNGGANYTATAEYVTLSGLEASASGYSDAVDAVKSCVDGYGEVAVEWRALIPAYASDALVPIDKADDIVAAFGSVSEGSELGFGALCALRGSQGKRVYALNTGGADRSSFQAALRKLEASKLIYAIGVLTDDEDIMDDVADHSERMSAASIKRFRRAYVGTDSPGEYPLLQAREDDTLYSVSIVAGIGGAYNVAIFEDSDVDFSTLSVSAGDLLRLPGSGAEYVIAGVDSGDPNYRTLTLEDTGLAAPVTSITGEVWAADTAENTARYVYRRSERLGSGREERRRIANIWVDNGYNDDGTGTQDVVPCRFLACEVAGLRTALLPQQPLTRSEVTSISDAPTMYTRYSPELLDEMAARGVFIITQEEPGGECFIRHQLTAEVDSGSLYYEDSCGVNLDSVCFAIDDALAPYYGVRNVTQRTLTEIKNVLLDLLGGLTQTDYDAEEIGPQINQFYDRHQNPGTLTVEIHPTFRDRIRVYTKLEIPLPLNVIEVTVEADTIRGDGITSNILSVTTVA